MDPPAENQGDKYAGETVPTTSELFSSAKLVSEAAQTCFQGGAENVDKGKVAGAAADLLGAASRYGKLEEKGYGEYIGKAETYLEQYSSGGSAPGATPDAADADAPPAAPAAAPDSSTAAPAADEDKTADGGYGESVKLAEGLLGGGGGEEGKSEGILKLAGGFFK